MTTPTTRTSHGSPADATVHGAAALLGAGKTAAVAARVYSPFQQDIFINVADGTGHTCVEAGPGSGKTTTMIASLDHVPPGKRVIMLAFSNKIRDELKSRAPQGVTVLGLNQLGMRACLSNISMNLEVDEGKVPAILEDLVSARAPRYLAALLRDAEALQDPEDRELAMESYRDERRQYLRAAHKIVGLAKATLSSKPEEIRFMLDDRGVELPTDVPEENPDGSNGPDAEGEDHSEEDRAEMIRLVRRVLEISWQEREKSIDYDDQIWLPIVMNMRLPQYDYVFIDEVQDLTPCQLEMVMRVCRPGGRIFAIGDEYQSIFAFRGADHRTMRNIRVRLNAKSLPLSICYRCAKSIVAEAKKIVPRIEAAPDAPEGVVRSTVLARLGDELRPGDFVISRTNAPLVELCMELLRDERPAVIQGVDLTDKFMGLIKKSRAKTVEELEEWVEEWREREGARLERKHKDPKVADDTAASLLALCEDARSVEHVKSRVERLFSDQSTEGKIILSSTHRAKGLETDRAFLLSWTFSSGKEGMSEAERIEERNLLYVAITRARKELVYVAEKGPGQ